MALMGLLKSPSAATSSSSSTATGLQIAPSRQGTSLPLVVVALMGVASASISATSVWIDRLECAGRVMVNMMVLVVVVVIARLVP